MADTMSMGLNTQISDPSGSVGGVAGAAGTASPGGTGPGAQMSMTNAVVLTIGTAAAGLLALGIVFRKGGVKLPPLRVDAANAINVYFSWLLVNGTLKLVAYHWHGHKVSQAFLLVA
jgi:hypothetical protein